MSGADDEDQTDKAQLAQQKLEAEQREHAPPGALLINASDVHFLSEHAEVGKSVESRRVYTWNKTGNLYFSTTNAKFDEDGNPVWETLNPMVRKAFQEVCVFWAALTRSLVARHLSLFDCDALERAIDSSGLFAHMTHEESTKVSSDFGLSFSKNIIGAFLGLGTGVPFATSLVSAIVSDCNTEQSISFQSDFSKAGSRMAHVVFICEEIFELPIISVMVVSVEAKQVKESIKVGPCFSQHSTWTSMDMHKDTYLFVQPESIKKYSGPLISAMTNPQHAELTEMLRVGSMTEEEKKEDDAKQQKKKRRGGKRPHAYRQQQGGSGQGPAGGPAPRGDNTSEH